MSKKSYIYTFLFIIIIGLGYYFYKNFFEKKENISLFLAVPERTTAFFYSENISDLHNKLDSLSYINKLESASVFKSFKTHLIFLDSLSNKLNKDNFSYNKIGFTINNTGSTNFDFLTIIELNQNPNLLLIKKILSENEYSFQDYNYKSYKVLTATETKTKKQINFSVFQNLVLISHNTPLVEASINALSKETHKSSSSSFKKLNIITEENTDLHLFLDYNNSEDLNTILFNSAFLSSKKSVTKTANWSYSIIDFNSNNISFKTNYSFENTDNSSIDYLSHSTPSKFSLDMILPNNTAYFEAFSSKSNKIFQTSDNSYKYFKDWVFEEAAYFCLETFDEDYHKRSGLVIKTSNIDTVKLHLAQLNTDLTPISNYNGLDIYEMNIDVLSKFFKSNLFELKRPFFVFIGKYIVFANDMNVLKTCFQKYKANNFLKSDVNFQEFIGSNNSFASKTIYLNPKRCNTTLTSIFNKNMLFSDFGKTKIETFVTDSSTYSVGKISFTTNKTKKTTKIWELDLDAKSTFKTQIVFNADNKRKEIFTQDEKNKVYLINQTGEILFKKEIKEKILGDVFQVDLYKSGKLQYVFNSSNYVYVIDRKGQFLDGFPLKLPAESSNSIMVVNYDNEKNYRYFVACKNNNIYAYESNGKPLKSWSPMANVGLITNRIKHSVFSGKDFIYFNNSKGVFYALNRKGENRFEEIGFDTKFDQAFEKTSKGFVNFGEGSIFKVDLKGEMTAKILGDSTYTKFTNYNKKGAFAIGSKNEFRVAKSKWTILGKKTLNDEIICINKHIIQDQVWFLVQCKNSVYLINELGEIHPDFPMLSNSETRISKFYNNKSKIMLLTEGNKLKAFELVVPN